MFCFLRESVYNKNQVKRKGRFNLFSCVQSIGLFGMQTYPVAVETSLETGMPRIDIVGLPDAAVSESRDRVRAAMKNSGFLFPNARVTINLSPADKRKEGPMYDLPIFISVLKASGQLSANTDGCAFLGELSLSGQVRKVNGILPMVIDAKERGLKAVYLPFDNAAESCVISGIDIYPVLSCKDLIRHLKGEKSIRKADREQFPAFEPQNPDVLDFADVKGQFQVKRALEIAAAGGHNTLMIGPPGSGKSMIAKRIPTILPDMTPQESLETTKIYSIAGILSNHHSLVMSRPFRAPHHSISPAGLSGGGQIPKPGELSLAHHGVLFLDELPEFPRQTMETLRQPMEDGCITIARVSGSITYPCDVMLVCAMNPCPCGYYGHPTKKCTCPPHAPAKYLAKVSGPLLDRLDIHIEVPQVEFEKLSDEAPGESSKSIRARVNAARKIQQTRLADSGITCNAKMTAAQTRRFCKIDDKGKQMLERSFELLGLSARAYDKILRVARTIADLENSEAIAAHHIAEAIQYRSLDRKFWKA